MAERKIVTSTSTVKPSPVTSTLKSGSTTRQPGVPLFEKENFMWMAIGIAVIGLSMLLMAGGKNENPNQFDYNLVYSTRRVTIAPILFIIGLLIEVYAIFKKPKAHS